MTEQERPYDQVFLPVDQRRFELLTSPVRGVPKAFAGIHSDARSLPSMQVTGLFRNTGPYNYFRLHPIVMLFFC